ncbi:MAG: IscS subfamily cysteine desulfurase [Candidatus Woesebacteria bacterium]|jgi:cysteine desulfurase
MNSKKSIYLDYAATTPVDPRVIKAMLPYFNKKFANAATIYKLGLEAKKAVEDSRRLMAEALGAVNKEVFFTSSATESNNTVLKGIAFANKDKGNHIIISEIEHDCILNSAKWLKKQGFKITRLKVDDRYGRIHPKSVAKAITDETILVSILHANNEIGTIQDIAKIGQICRQKGVYFHTDAAQSFAKIPINIKEMNIDLLTASAHKIYGPKGVALLYIKQGVAIEPLLHGGGQESNMRSSTSNTAAIVGFAKATELCLAEMEKESKRLTKLRDKVIKTVLSKIPETSLNGHPTERLANNINLSFSFVEGESIILLLDAAGISASTGSACSSKNLEPSHVLKSCGIKAEKIHGSLRLSLGRWTNEKDIDYLLKTLPAIIKKLRKVSPFRKK